ncbi:hypothetical protein vseg_007311 [Gypsophila vaccaria]
MSRRLLGLSPINPFNPEIEAQARRLNAARRRTLSTSPPRSTSPKSSASTSSHHEESVPHQPMVGSIADQSAPNQLLNSSIIHSPVNANNFEIKMNLIQYVKQKQFSGISTENPNEHINIFLKACDNVKIKGVSDDAIRLRLFPNFLRGRAKE